MTDQPPLNTKKSGSSTMRCSKDIVSLTLTLGWKNKKQPIGSTELDLEAGNLVSDRFLINLPFL